MRRSRRDESFSGHPNSAVIFSDGVVNAAVSNMANPVLKRGRDT